MKENDLYLMRAKIQAKTDKAHYDLMKQLNRDNRNAKIKLFVQLGVIWGFIITMLVII